MILTISFSLRFTRKSSHGRKSYVKSRPGAWLLWWSKWRSLIFLVDVIINHSILSPFLLFLSLLPSFSHRCGWGWEGRERKGGFAFCLWGLGRASLGIHRSADLSNWCFRLAGASEGRDVWISVLQEKEGCWVYGGGPRGKTVSNKREANRKQQSIVCGGGGGGAKSWGGGHEVTLLFQLQREWVLSKIF